MPDYIQGREFHQVCVCVSPRACACACMCVCIIIIIMQEGGGVQG